MIPHRLNYLHRGSDLAGADDLRLLPVSGSIRTHELRRLLPALTSPGLRTVLAHYRPAAPPIVDIDALRRDLEQTIQARALFRRIGCRGFSYAVWSDVPFEGEPLRDDIDVRVALLPESDLFYPDRLRRYLRRGYGNHVRGGAFESIAFALAAVKARTCHVLVLQSDLARRRPSYVREHFRGWRKILFLVVASLVRHRADDICVFRALDVARSCHRSFLPTATQIAAWESIYDRTAADFGLRLAALDECADLRIYASEPCVCARVGYVGNVHAILRRFSRDHA